MGKKKRHLVFLTGAGMSKESGISTFRDFNGLWEKHSIEEVASPQGFENNPQLVLDFYNKRRDQLFNVEPNTGHYLIAGLEKDFEVSIVTQNVDDLHERSGSSNVLHLHGELRKVRSTVNESLVYAWEKDLNLGDLCKEGHQLRPHIVWFGEAVPLIETASEIVQSADVLVVLGTSLQVYPAAGLMNYAKPLTPVYYIDPNPAIVSSSRVEVIEKGASDGMNVLIKRLSFFS